MGLLDSVAPQDAPVQAAPQDNGQAAYNFFVSQGLPPHQAAGIVGNLQGESGQNLNPAAVNKGDGRDGSDSIGIGQWNGTRAQALKDYAASKGSDWTDLNTQLEFLHSELKGPESKAYAKLQAAQTPEEAGQAMLAYERPKDWNKAGAHPERAQYAARAYSTYGKPSSGTPVQASPTTPQQPLSILPTQLAANQNSQPATPASPATAIPQQAQAPMFPSAPPPASAPVPNFAQIPQAPLPQINFAQHKPVDLSTLRAYLTRTS